MKCERCQNDFPTSELKADIKGNRLVCKSCLDLIRTGKLVPERVRESARLSYEEARAQHRKLALSTSERLELYGKKAEMFECRSCNYKFVRSPGFRGICPYCGADSVVQWQGEKGVKEIDEMVGEE